MVKSAMALILRRRGRRRRRAARPAQQVAEAAVDARGQEDDEDDEEQPVDRLGHAHVGDAEHHAEHLGQRDRERGADGGAEERVHSSEHDREYDAQRDADAGERVGVHVGDVLRVRDAADGGEHGREHGDADLEARDVDADRGRRRLVLADRLHRRARHRAVQPVPDPEPERPQHEPRVIEDALVGELHGHEAVDPRRAHRQPQRAARPVALRDDEQADDLADGEGDEAEVVADDREARARVGDHDGEQHAPDQTARAHARLPRMPPGRAKIMTMKNTKAITYPISVDHITPPIEMTSLMMNDATKAPTMFPSPPSTQIMNVSGPKAAPKKGCTEYWMISSAAATPASAPPTAEVTTYTVRGLAPISAIASRSCETARMAVPM